MITKLTFFRWAVCCIVGLIGLTYIPDSAFGAFLIILASGLFAPYITKLLQKQFPTYNKKLVTILSSILGFIFLISGISIYSNSPSTKARLEKVAQQKQESKSKADEEKKTDGEKKQAEKNLQDRLNAEASSSSIAEKDRVDASNLRAENYQKGLKAVVGLNGVWFENENDKPFRVGNISLNYNFGDNSQIFDFVYPQGAKLKSIRKENIFKGMDSRVFTYTEFVTFPSEKTYFIKGVNNVINVQLQGYFDDPLNKSGTNEFTVTFSAN